MLKEDIIFAVLFLVVLVFSVTGNSLVIHIINNERGLKTSTNYLLLNLALADLLFGVFLAPGFIFLPFVRHSVADGALGDWLCKLVLSSNISWMAALVCVLSILTLSIERYFAVCHPHTFRQRFSRRNVKILILMSWIYSFLLSLLGYIWVKRDDLDGEGRVCTLVRSFSNNLYATFITAQTCLSALMMIFSLVKICISLWCKQTVEPTGQREITERKKRRKVTLSVLAVAVTFMVCWIPCYVSYFLVVFDSDIIRVENRGNLRVVVLLMLVNSALDPYLYRFSSFSSLFRKIIRCNTNSSRISNTVQSKHIERYHSNCAAMKRKEERKEM